MVCELKFFDLFYVCVYPGSEQSNIPWISIPIYVITIIIIYLIAYYLGFKEGIKQNPEEKGPVFVVEKD